VAKATKQPTVAKPRLDERGRLISPGLDRLPNGEPIMRQLPTYAEMVDLDDGQLADVMELYGIQKPWRQLQADAMGYATQMMQLPEGASEEMILREVQRLTGIGSQGSRRALLGGAREAQRAFTMSEFMRDNPPDQLYVRVPEGDESTCDRCLEYAGIEGTIPQHAEDPGLPGFASCDGGSYCRCVLIPVD